MDPQSISIHWTLKAPISLFDQAKALGVAPGSPFSRGGGPSRPPRGATRGASWRGRGRGAVANTLASMRLDLRPRKLLVSNYEPEEQAQIRSHFEVSTSDPQINEIQPN